ncbi:helix-turn-helix domain-containing protein [uncultured Phascolarctobacterium sp.]|uniref:helix-turn-helix domain-containing protein n=1 Tax=uncultured Phascolarctobacterium sp. TaxID=512296 RepID=UPI0035A90E45
MKLITAQEAAQILRQNKPDKIYLLVRSKCLSGFKCGKRWLIDEDSVYKYIQRELLNS